jgi:hypothetical protein
MKARYPGTIGSVQGAKNINKPAKKAAGMSDIGSIALFYPIIVNRGTILPSHPTVSIHMVNGRTQITSDFSSE